MVPSSSYYTIRPEIARFWNCHETKQVWYDERFFNWNQLWLWNLFAILNVRVLCRWSSSTMTVSSPAPTWFWYSPACTSFIEMESQWLGWRSCSGGIGSMERAEVRDQPELHLTITESLYKVFVRLPGRVSQFLHQWTQYSKKASSQYSQYAKKVSSQDTLCFNHTSIPDCWLRRRNLIFHLPTGEVRPVKRKLSVLDPTVRLPPNHEEASVSSVSCLNMTFLVNEGR